MPFTPYHLGPALLIALVFYPFIDIPTFLIANIILDIEPFTIMLTSGSELHGRFHSITLGTGVGLLLAIIVTAYRKYGNSIEIETRLDYNSSIKQTLITSIVGVWLHVLLDAFLYPDLNLFYPFEWNPLLGLFSLPTIQRMCLLSFPLAIMVYLLRVTIIWLRDKRSNSKQLLAEPVDEEPLFIFSEEDLSLNEPEPQ
jgi:membrane-bound metal-dependent hydrolase YbcI (DUF457 family)